MNTHLVDRISDKHQRGTPTSKAPYGLAAIAAYVGDVLVFPAELSRYTICDEVHWLLNTEAIRENDR